MDSKHVINVYFYYVRITAILFPLRNREDFFQAHCRSGKVLKNAATIESLQIFVFEIFQLFENQLKTTQTKKVK